MRTIVVASGKGGTGKTTMTALFAHVATGTRGIALADADVEASNLPIALLSQTISCKAFSGGSTARIDPQLCAGCGACVRACRFGAIYTPDEDDPFTPYAVDPWACEGCGACVYGCPALAITMEPQIAGEACTGSSSVGPIAFGKLGPGQDLSGRLVTEVRERAVQLAQVAEAELLLIDGPPGVGCPTIAAITNTDLLVGVTEPSRSGAHDLERLIGLAAKLRVPVVAVLNKADLSSEGAQGVRELCRERDVPLLGEVPFDPALAGFMGDLVRGADPGTLFAASPGLKAAAEVWDCVEQQFEPLAPRL